MSSKKPIIIKLNKNIKVEPDDCFESKVVKSGNGAVINAYKKYIGRLCTVIIHSKKKVKKKEFKELEDSAGTEGWKKV